MGVRRPHPVAPAASVTRPGRPPTPVHYLRPNDAVWTPPAVIFADTETRPLPGVVPETLALRCWVAHYTDRRTRKGARARDEWAQGTTADEFALWVQTVTRNRDAVWIYFHNLSFDLTVTRLPLVLAGMGWTITDAAIGGRAPWLRIAKGERVLTVVDSWSWLPVALEAIGAAVKVPKPPLPADADDLAVWYHRCRADVTILETAVLDLMGWWDRHRLGRWTISGASSGWNAYRHKQAVHTVERTVHTTKGDRVRKRKVALEPVTIDPDPDKIAADRLCVHGGRRGTWSVGDHAAGPFAEIDFVAAYPTVAAHLPLPAGRARGFASLPVDDSAIGSDRWGITARVRIRTDRPRWPVRAAGGTWYPVGEFWADLAGPDIAEARRLGCLVEIGHGFVHRLGHNMLPWARWVLAVQTGAEPDTPPVAQLAAKSWGRTVIGKWASRGFERTPLGPAPTSGWGYEEGIHHETGAPGGMVDLAGRRWWVAASGNPDNAYPAVLAWVEAEVRTRLARVIDALGPGCVLQCDTDGLIIAERSVGTPAARGHLLAPPRMAPRARLTWCLDQIDPVVSPLALRVKQRHSHVTVLGPQHLITDKGRRFAGLPGTAEETSPGTFKVKQWPKLQWQVAHGSAAGYVLPEVTAVVKGPWPTGWVLDDHTVVPPEAVIDSAGNTRILGWNSTGYARAGLRPADRQHPLLEPLL